MPSPVKLTRLPDFLPAAPHAIYRHISYRNRYTFFLEQPSTLSQENFNFKRGCGIVCGGVVTLTARPIRVLFSPCLILHKYYTQGQKRQISQ